MCWQVAVLHVAPSSVRPQTSSHRVALQGARCESLHRCVQLGHDRVQVLLGKDAPQHFLHLPAVGQPLLRLLQVLAVAVHCRRLIVLLETQVARDEWKVYESHPIRVRQYFELFATHLLPRLQRMQPSLWCWVFVIHHLFRSGALQTLLLQFEVLHFRGAQRLVRSLPRLVRCAIARLLIRVLQQHLEPLATIGLAPLSVAVRPIPLIVRGPVHAIARP